MDPVSAIGLAASIIAVTQLTAAVISACHDYPSASADRLRIVNALEDLKLVLEKLHNLANDSGKQTRLTMVEQICQPNGPVDRCSKALTLLKRKLAPPQNTLLKIKQMVKWPLEKKDAQDVCRYLLEAKSTIQLALAEDQIDLIANLQDDLSTFQNWMKTEAIVALNTIQQGIDEIKTSNETLEQEALRRRMHTWLDAIDNTSNYVRHMKERQENTGHWFLDGHEFFQWKSTIDEFGFFWLRGGMGMGKSVQCSAVIENVTFWCSQDASIDIAYFYFDFRNPRKLHLIDLLKSLVSQLSNSTDALRILESLYSKHQDGRTLPSSDAIADSLQDILKVGKRTYMIVDALDECVERKELLLWLEKVTASALPNVRFFCTSRREQDLEECLEYLATTIVDFEKTLVDIDVRLYLTSQLRTDKRLSKWRPEVQKEIEDKLMADAQGMFRWVACQVDVLRKCFTLPTLRQKLKSLPSTLNETYSRILLAIEEEYRDYAQKILQWLAFSARPLSLDEVIEALAIDLDGDNNLCFNPDLRLPDPQAVFTICSSLIYMEKSTVNLAHFSVKEYLMSGEIKIGDTCQFYLEKNLAEEFIARSCIAYLLQFDQDELCAAMVHKSSLAEYAATYWVKHAQSASKINSTPLDRLVWKLFQPSSKAFYNWIRLFDIDDVWRKPEFWRPWSRIPGRLYYCSLAGFTVIVDLLLAEGADVNARGGDYGNALEAASYGGHLEIVRLLIENGAEVNAQGGYFGNALQAASYRGHLEIVCLLIERGGEVNARGGDYGNALQAASYGGHLEIVRLLIEREAEVNAQGGRYGNALQAASDEGHLEIVHLLVENGAEVNAQGGFYGNILQAASCGGNLEIVRLLIEKGAEVNAQGGLYGTALQAASTSYAGHLEIIRLLIEKAAEVNAQGGYYRNALNAASWGGHLEIVCLLIEKGAEVKVQGGKYGNALQAASCGGNLEIVRVLIEKGAEVNAQGGDDGNALQAASYGGHLAIVSLLIENGAEVNAQGGDCGNALQAASYRGHLEIVNLLIEKGAEVNAQGGDYGTVVQAASYGGRLEIVRLLIEKGAEVDAHGGDYGTALQAASYAGYLEVVRLLFENGADVNAQGGGYGNALQAASYAGHLETVHLLIENGADVNAQGGRYGNALQAASDGGHPEIVRLLIEKGAEVNAQGGYYGTALQVVSASCAGHLEIVRLLVEKGAEVNVQGGDYGNALQAASYIGHLELVRLLVEKGAEVNAQGGSFGSALEAASFGGHLEIVSLLIENGAEVNAQGGSYRNALYAASYGGHLEIICLLIEKGAEVNAQGDNDGNALQAALAEGHLEIVRLLVEKGAEVNAQ